MAFVQNPVCSRHCNARGRCIEAGAITADICADMHPFGIEQCTCVAGGHEWQDTSLGLRKRHADVFPLLLHRPLHARPT